MSDYTSILQMARGAIQERTDYEMARILENIVDPNTKSTGPRKLVLTMIFRPDDERQIVDVTVSAKSTLQPTSPVKTSLYITEDTAVELVPNIPGQLNLNGEEEGVAPVLRVIKSA